MPSSKRKFAEVLAIDIRIADDRLSVELSDGRIISAPVAWYPRLAEGSAKERGDWRLIGGGRGIHWPRLEEDISVANLLAGQRSKESAASLKRWLAGRTKVAKNLKGAMKPPGATSTRRKKG